ncbi:GNAT family N-acetyltransferase [Saccharibacillus alkalitolerans]|uniref:GNAT family N-acetyltransferase n=1 Tax=Saccharibacillus alkalitolerans TaxID=2705290 RepID=A0ABX0FEC4_9BACL|nr:GNAT family N-acetyltransferase [Saccharibacillus alkalitolerans]NGZ77667.1 GNAT family N-acetyltransferase [Saccharibacillus alkalitolerans]
MQTIGVPLLPSSEQVEAVERSEIEYMTDRMLAIRSRDGNPEGVEIATFGSAVAFASETMPWPAFNTVKGLTDAHAGDLESILEFYRGRGRKAQLEIVPSQVGPGFLRRMAELGLHQSGFHCSLIAAPGEYVPGNSEAAASGENKIAIREIGRDEFELYAMLHCRGTGLPDSGIPHVKRNNEVLHGRPGWSFYAAELDGTPAAAAVLFRRSGRASLTFAATLPEFRGRGLHRRLLEHRIAQAFSENGELVVGQCSFLSQSHRNMEHAGMKLGYVRTSWTEL